MDCIIDVEMMGCFNFSLPFGNSCMGRPVSIMFRYNGGSCAQSDNLQDRQKFDCFDVEPSEGGVGPPPTTGGTRAYIVATTLGGADVYFEGFVDVGETYSLNEDLEYAKLSADMNITVYDPMGSEDPATIVQYGNTMQTMFLHLSCSQPLYLFDRFGAQQVVEWMEDDGRVVSAFIDVPVGEMLSLSLNATGISGQDSVRLLEMNILSNTDGFINKTDEINGVILTEGEVLELEPINITVDLTRRTRYTFFTTVVGETLDGSAECNGFDFHECEAGVNLPPAFPTIAPTPSPTITPYPTPDPEDAECVARSTIDCQVSDPRGVTCDQLSGLTEFPRCPSGSNLTMLQFNFTGSKCGSTEGCTDLVTEPMPEEVYIEITDCETTAFFQGSANIGNTISVNPRGNFLCPTIEVAIMTADFDAETESNNGEILQTLVLPTDCLDRDESRDGWTLLTNYGAFQLVRYRTETGFQSAEATVTMTYSIGNSGAFSAAMDEAFLESAFSGVEMLLNDTAVVPPRSRLQLGQEAVKLDLLGSAGTTLDFSLSVAGALTTTAQQPCASDESFEFTV
jgi:hypothetical protein